MLAAARPRAVLACLLVSTVVAGLLTGLSASPARASTTTLSGVDSGGTMATANDFGTWRGSKVTIVSNYMPHDTWSDIANPGGGGPDSWKNPSVRLAWSLPMLPDSGGDLKTGATGAYNSYFKSLATKMIADNEGNSYIRLGWEMNGSWYPWSAVSDPTSYIAYWRQIVTTMRGVSGAHFQFVWSPENGIGNVDLTKEYPGDSYVDALGMTNYNRASGATPAMAADRWSAIWNGVDDQWGLRWLTTFAGQHGKPLGFSEWGLGSTCGHNNGGDDPYFIQQMHNYFANNNVAYETYQQASDDTCNVHDLRSGQFPKGAALYQKLWSKPYAPVVEPVTTGTAAKSTDVAVVSPNADRSAPYALNGADLEGLAFVYANVNATTTRSVAFYLDGASSVTHSETKAPFDFVGGDDAAAMPVELEDLAVGTHTMKTVVSDGSTTKTYLSTFTVGKPTPTSTSGSPAVTSDLLRVSTSASRSNPLDLNGATLVGNVYVFATPSVGGIQTVSFYVDGSPTAAHVENYAPWDFVGGTASTAKAFSSSSLKSGTHTLKAVFKTSGGSTSSTATFTVG